MKITAVRLFKTQGVMAHQEEFWEERLSRPVDIYPEHKAEGPTWMGSRRLRETAEGRYQIESHFVQIETDDGVSGLGGPISADQAFIIGHHLVPLLLGHDPLAIERIWDRLYRTMVHGRKEIPPEGEEGHPEVGARVGVDHVAAVQCQVDRVVDIVIPNSDVTSPSSATNTKLRILVKASCRL